jgi:hypothetical protein
MPGSFFTAFKGTSAQMRTLRSQLLIGELLHAVDGEHLTGQFLAQRPNRCRLFVDAEVHERWQTIAGHFFSRMWASDRGGSSGWC